MPTNNTEGLSPYDSSTVSEAVESFAESTDAPEEGAEELTELLEDMAQAIEQQSEKRLSHFRENTVHTVAVERVLLEYGISGKRVDEIIETVEAVDSELWGDKDE